MKAVIPQIPHSKSLKNVQPINITYNLFQSHWLIPWVVNLIPHLEFLLFIGLQLKVRLQLRLR